MPSPTILSVPPGHDIATLSATHVLETVGRDGLSKAVLLVPNRRAGIILRDAFLSITKGTPLLLPRIVPVADLQDELPLFLGTSVLESIRNLPPAMPDWQRLCLLAAQVRSFERGRIGEITLEQAMRLASDLAALHDNFTRTGQPLTMERLKALVAGDFAVHWQQSLSFLSIVAELWPDIEQAHGMITKEARGRAAVQLLIDHWRITPPDYPLFVIGSTASQPMTAELMHTVAELEQGAVILPGLDTSMEGWETIQAGHPTFHLKSFLDRWKLTPAQVKQLAEPIQTSEIWHHALGNIESWRGIRKLDSSAWKHVHMVPCQHAEEEARVIALLMRERAESANTRIALITPDESLIARVASQLKRYGILVDRLAAGTLASTEMGSLLCVLMDAVSTPERTLPLLNVLRHKLVTIGKSDEWKRWLNAAEPSFRGVVNGKPGQLPRLPDILSDHPSTSKVAQLMQELLMFSRSQLDASAWVKKLATLLEHIAPEAGTGAEAVEEALDALSFADLLGAVDCDGFSALLNRQLDTPWRGVGLGAAPNLFLLTPVEARLMQFDRVVIAGLRESLWPGLVAPGPWLNFSQQQALGLPSPQEHLSLMAHDLLMLGSMSEVFLTYSQREAGAPTARSSFIERLVAFLALQGATEASITATSYLNIARQLYASEHFEPAAQTSPRPIAAMRPRRLRVTALDTLFSDPYSIYAEYVLGLKALKDIDTEPEGKDFGTIAHAAIQQLATYWSASGAPTEKVIQQIAESALSKFSHRPNVQLFWRNRLLRALAYVNAQETQRRQHVKKVVSETKVEAAIDLPLSFLRTQESPLALADDPKEIPACAGMTNKMTLHGRIDRMEETGEGIIVADYKTGTIPTDKEISEGKAVQLLSYALILSESGQKVAATEYWRLPSANKEGAIRQTTVAIIDGLLEPLRAALATMLDEKTPFLARPLAANERFENDYDGISRYDEWAG